MYVSWVLPSVSSFASASEFRGGPSPKTGSSATRLASGYSAGVSHGFLFFCTRRYTFCVWLPKGDMHLAPPLPGLGRPSEWHGAGPQSGGHLPGAADAGRRGVGAGPAHRQADQTPHRRPRTSPTSVACVTPRTSPTAFSAASRCFARAPPRSPSSGWHRARRMWSDRPSPPRTPSSAIRSATSGAAPPARTNDLTHTAHLKKRKSRCRNSY